MILLAFCGCRDDFARLFQILSKSIEAHPRKPHFGPRIAGARVSRTYQREREDTGCSGLHCLEPFSEATFQPLESKECGSGVHGDVDPLPPEAAALWRILHVDLRHAWPGFLGVGARGQGLVRT